MVFFMVIHGSRSVCHGSRLAFIVFSRFQVDFCYGSRWNFMVFHGSRSVFHRSRLVFHGSRSVFHRSRLVFYGFSWFHGQKVKMGGGKLKTMGKG